MNLKVGKTLQGSQLYYPDLWQNSTFSRNYSLKFKFYFKSTFSKSEIILVGSSNNTYSVSCAIIIVI